MPDVKQIREELVQGARKALENYPKPDQRLVTVRAVDLLAALGESASPANTSRKTGRTEGGAASGE